jgi:RES domain
VAALLHSTTVPAGITVYRITSLNQLTTNKRQHRHVVDGRGVFKTRFGGRYNHRGVVTVYLTESVETCFAERMFYFHREYLQALDTLHQTYALVPPFRKRFVIWEIELAIPINGVAEVNPNTAGYFQIYPAMLKNPSQDYEHLKNARSDIQTMGYGGIRALSSRCQQQGPVLALFANQSWNVASIVPHQVEFSLLQPSGAAFTNQASHDLDFGAGAVQALANPNPLPAPLQAYANPQVVKFNH